MKKARPGKKRRERRPAKSRAARGGGTADGPGPALCSDGERKRPAKNDCGRMPPAAGAPRPAGRPRRPRPGHSPAPQRAMPGLSRHALRGARRGPLRRAVVPRPRALVPGGRNRREAWAPPPVLRCRAIKSRLSRRARRRIALQRGAGKHRGKPSPAQGLDVERPPQSGQGDKKWRRAVFRFAAQSCKGRSVGRLHGAASSVCPRCAPRSRAPRLPARGGKLLPTPDLTVASPLPARAAGPVLKKAGGGSPLCRPARGPLPGQSIPIIAKSGRKSHFISLKKYGILWSTERIRPAVRAQNNRRAARAVQEVQDEIQNTGRHRRGGGRFRRGLEDGEGRPPGRRRHHAGAGRGRSARRAGGAGGARRKPGGPRRRKRRKRRKCRKRRKRRRKKPRRRRPPRSGPSTPPPSPAPRIFAATGRISAARAERKSRDRPGRAKARRDRRGTARRAAPGLSFLSPVPVGRGACGGETEVTGPARPCACAAFPRRAGAVVACSHRWPGRFSVAAKAVAGRRKALCRGFGARPPAACNKEA